MPQKLSQFWQELKRRKVITVFFWYAGVAMVLIGLASDVAGPFHLPEGTLRLVIILIIIGFPLAMIFSWIFDISAKGIIITEKAANEVRFSPIANSIAVLPFQDMSSEKDQEYFCDGIAEEIINALAHVSSLKVIARTSAFAFKNQNVDIREIGQRLNVATLLEGSVRKDSNRIRITAQLIKTDDGTHLWSERFDRKLKDIFAIQDEISMAVVDKLKIKLLGDERSAVLKRYTDDFEVYNLYLKALNSIQMATSEGFEKAMDYIGKILQKNPQFVPGYTALGRIYFLNAFFGNIPPNTGYPKAKEYAEKTLEIDNSAGEAHYIMGMVNTYYDWDWDAAKSHFEYAQKINPNLGWIHVGYSTLLSIIGHFADAIEEGKKAVELDPLSGFFSAQLGVCYYHANKFEQAIHHLKQTVTTFPDFYMGHWTLGIAYRCISKMDEAIEEYRKAVELSNQVPIVVEFLALALYETGNEEEAKKLIKGLEKRSEKEYVPAIGFMPYYLFMGDHDQAYKWVERAIREHDSYLPLNLIFPIKKYRIPNEPRYVELLKETGLRKFFEIEER